MNHRGRQVVKICAGRRSDPAPTAPVGADCRDNHRVDRGVASVSVYAGEDQLHRCAAARIAELAEEAIAKRGRCTLALSGGNTPGPVYAQLAAPRCAHRIDWARLQIVFGDERCVSPFDRRSNYALAKAALFDRAPIPATNIHRIHGEAAPVRAAASYARVLKSLFGTAGSVTGPPRTGCDVVLLGLGTDGHTASIFPRSRAIGETRRWVLSEYVPAVRMWRITLTPVVFNAARHVIFLVAGIAKAGIVNDVLAGPDQPQRWPAQAIRPTDGSLQWLIDKAAASALEEL